MFPQLSHEDFRVELSDPRDHWSRDRAIVSVSDLGLTVKSGRGGLTVLVTSLADARGREGVELTAYSVNNQVLAKGMTNGDGVARLELAEKHPDGAPFVVVAKNGEDTGFLRLDFGCSRDTLQEALRRLLTALA